MKPCPCCGKEPQTVMRENQGFSVWHDCEDFYLELHRWYKSEILAEEAWDKVVESLKEN